MSASIVTEKPGTLHSIGRHALGLYTEYEYFRCDDCGTDYPMIHGCIKCNGYAIRQCPWCGDDPVSKRAAECR